MKIAAIRAEAEAILRNLDADEPAYYPYRQTQATALLVLAVCALIDNQVVIIHTPPEVTPSA